jgi:hypothetical protein
MERNTASIIMRIEYLYETQQKFVNHFSNETQ